ncbi:MAG: hypothetical protein PVI90_07870 [Desulfobacteraceae bacterium]
MAQYCVSNFSDHQIHKVIFCNHLPNQINRTTFYADSDAEAIRKARAFYADAGCCIHCMAKEYNR